MNAHGFSVLTICGLEELTSHSDRGVSHVLSILDPGWPEPEAFWSFDPHHRTTLHFHDDIEPRRASPARKEGCRDDPRVRARLGGRPASPPHPLPRRHFALDGGDDDDPRAGVPKGERRRDRRAAAENPPAGVAEFAPDRLCR